MKDIPAGYQIHITTWENDADAYLTIIKSGLSKEDTIFLIELSNKFRTHHQGSLGGEEWPNSDLEEVLKSVLEDFEPGQYLKDQANLYIEHEDVYHFLCETILGWPVDEYFMGNMENYCRVVESYQVFNYTAPVENVTNQFSEE